MSEREQIALIDRLRALPTETEHQPVDRKDVDLLLLTKLPDRLSKEQKLRKVHNLLQELRRSGRIDNRGTRKNPQWVAIESGPEGNSP